MPLMTKETMVSQAEVIGFKCDCCGKEYVDDPFELQEAMFWSNTGGYGSVFGDGNSVELVICQHCTKKLLGKYIRDITET